MNWDLGGVGERAGEGRATMLVGSRGEGSGRRGFRGYGGSSAQREVCTSSQSFAFTVTSSSEQLVSVTVLT